MKNKVTVTRAPRLKSVPLKEIPDGTICLSSGGITVNDQLQAFVALKTGHGLIHISGMIPLDFHLPVDGHVTFDSFDAMCKWVANGKRLEDLQVDSGNEWVKFPEIPIGTIFSYGGGTIAAIKSDYGMSVKLDGDFGSVLLSIDKLARVWPVRFDLGDTITIEITE
jgi:hypothetical protein